MERLLDHGDYVIITTDTELDVTDHPRQHRVELVVAAALGAREHIVGGQLHDGGPQFVYAGPRGTSSMGAAMHMGPRKVIWIAGATGRIGQAVERLLDHGLGFSSRTKFSPAIFDFA